MRDFEWEIFKERFYSYARFIILASWNFFAENSIILASLNVFGARFINFGEFKYFWG